MKAIGRIGDMRSCGAMIISTYNTSVFSNGRLVATLFSLDSHGGQAISSYSSVFVEYLPIITIGDVNNWCCWVYPPHFSQPLVTGDFNVYGE